MNRKNWETYFEAVRSQKWDSAMRVLRKISAQEKDDPQVFLKLGDVYQKNGDTVQATLSYHRSARLLRARGFSQKAIALYKIILRLDPDDGEATAGCREVMREIEGAKKASISSRLISGPAVEAADKKGPISANTSKETRIPKLFSGMSEEAFHSMLDDFEVKSYSSGERVIEEGDSGDSMYLISSGKAKVIAHLMGKEIELAELGEGDLFGEVAFLTGRPRTAEVVAEGPLRVLEVGRLDIERIVERTPEVLSRIEDFYEKRAMDTIMKIRTSPSN